MDDVLLWDQSWLKNDSWIFVARAYEVHVIRARLEVDPGCVVCRPALVMLGDAQLVFLEGSLVHLGDFLHLFLQLEGVALSQKRREVAFVAADALTALQPDQPVAHPAEGGARRLSFRCPCGCGVLCGIRI